MQEIELPGGNYITNLFDGTGLLEHTWLKKSNGTVLDHHGYSYDNGFYRQTATRGIGQVHLEYDYDPIGQLIKATAYDTNGIGMPRLNEEFTYGYDKAANLSARTNGVLWQWFSTDKLDQLTNVTRGTSMTVAGTLTLAPQTNSVTVNGVYGQVYSDLTFATAVGVALSDGNNTLTTRLQNSSGQALTKTNTQNLPVSVNFQYDYDGNMTSDGLHTFEYDDADRLTGVTLPNAWKVTYGYDGLWRRRTAYQYGWNGSGWSLTNPVAYVYDRMLPIQERSGLNNNVIASYTRGLDLSGSSQGAGGIRGLLARTDASSVPAFYFGDAGGNITTLINSSGVKQASYLYDPFGNLLAMSGPLAAANHYRFSSKEVDPLSSDYYFGFRFYSPNLQRWRNADPIGLWAGANVHGFVRNNPISNLGPLGLSWYKDLFNYVGDKELSVADSVKEFFLGPPGGVQLKDPDILRAGSGLIQGLKDEQGNDITKETVAEIALQPLLAVLGGPEREGATIFGDAAKCKKLAKLGDAAEAVGAIDRHHQLPSQFIKNFERAGIKNIDDYIIQIDKAAHRLKPNGLHTGKGAENWNGAWKEFFGNSPNASKQQILDQLSKMRKDFGLE